MQKNNFKWLMLLPLLFFATMMRAISGLTVINTNGYEQHYAISLIGKITLNEGIMCLYDHNNTLLGSTNIDQIGRIVMNEEAVEDVETINSLIRVFSDPSQQQLIVSGLASNQKIRVFDSMGRLLITTTTQSKQTCIGVSSLPNGTYLLQFGAQVVKFVKQ